MVQLWKIVGGVDGGILVKEGAKHSSAKKAERLATGSIVEEVELIQDRLHFRRKTGSGPSEGWITTALPEKVLAKRVEAEDCPELQSKESPPVEAPETGDAELLRNAAAIFGEEKAKEMMDQAEKENAACADAPKDDEPTWIQESRARMQAFRDGVKVYPTQKEWPLRITQLGGVHPSQILKPFKRLNHKEMAEMSPKNLPGCFSGAGGLDKFPHTSEQLLSFGPDWYTQAFHLFGTLPKDNRVTRIVSVKQLPHSGFDAAGGAGHKALIEVEYAKPDKELHTKLFAKMPWDYFESDIGKQYRMQISTYNDVDSQEIMTSICCEHLLPFRIPKLYFADICRETTNYVLIVEQILFGKRGKLVNGKIVEKIERPPFQMLPVCGKYQDYLLEDPAKIYYTLFRMMGQLAAWDQVGNYDFYFGPMQKYTEEQCIASFGGPGGRKQKQKRADIARNGAMTMTKMGTDFAMNVGSVLFTPQGRDKKNLEKMTQEIGEMALHKDDILQFLASSSDWVAAMHMNLQADNAYFWPDEHGDYDGGCFDWCGFTRTSFVGNFNGCLSGAEADLLDAHEEGVMTMFVKEYERYGGPHLEVDEILLRYRLNMPFFVMDCGQWVERDMYVETPKEEWKGIKSRFDKKFVDRWNTRCRGTTLINAYDYYPRRPFKKIFDEWKKGRGKAFITEYS